MSFASVAYLLAAFLTAYAALFLWLSYREPPKRGLFNFKTVMFLFALLYVALAHFSVLTGVAYGVELTNQADCEMILENITTYYKYGNNYSGYHWDYNIDDAPSCANPNDFDCVRLFHEYDTYNYVDSCATRTKPVGVQFLLEWYYYLIFIDLAAIILGLGFLGLKRVLFRW